uniref:Uncharacterized protein n=1 Tax=Chloracidobacterium thermophilum TaxID=458033 RepID=A8DJW3_9BACT|nr:hypothetical protein YS_M60-F11.206 [Chloracidobacterium thermophilum]
MYLLWTLPLPLQWNTALLLQSCANAMRVNQKGYLFQHFLHWTA